MHDKRIGTYGDTQRWRCLSCGKTYVESLPAINGKREMTERSTKWASQQSFKRVFASIAQKVGIDQKSVCNTVWEDYI